METEGTRTTSHGSASRMLGNRIILSSPPNTWCAAVWQDRRCRLRAPLASCVVIVRAEQGAGACVYRAQVQDLLAGEPCSSVVMAMGVSGAGKTFTIEVLVMSPGLLKWPRASCGVPRTGVRQSPSERLCNSCRAARRCRGSYLRLSKSSSRCAGLLSDDPPYAVLLCCVIFATMGTPKCVCSAAAAALTQWRAAGDSGSLQLRGGPLPDP